MFARQFPPRICRYLLLFATIIFSTISTLKVEAAASVNLPDRDRSILNAQQETPPFLIGWYGGAGASASLSSLVTEQNAGANITVIYNPKETSGDILKSFLDAAADTKIKVIVEIPEEWIADRKAKLFKPDPPSIEAFVRTYEGHPALYGWYLYDEPEYEQFPTPEQLQSLYSVIKKVDPNHPVAMAFGNYHCWNYGGPAGDSHIEDYVTIPDLILFDQYPIFNQAELQPYMRQLQIGLWEEYHRLEDIPYMIDNCTNYIKSHHNATYQGFIPTLQGFKWSAANRYPTYSELRYMVYASLVRDVQGIILWNNYWNAGEPDNQQFKQLVAYPLMKEARSLAVVAQNGVYDDPQLWPDRPLSGPVFAMTRYTYEYWMSYKFGIDGENQYLIAVNDSRQKQSLVVFTLPSSVTSQTAEVLFEDYDPSNSAAPYKSRTIQLEKNDHGQPTLTDTFTPYQVHIYILGPVGDAK